MSTRWEPYPLITYTPGDGWVTPPPTVTYPIVITSNWSPNRISRVKLIKALAEMWAKNLITYDEMKKALESA